jgi:hypothetical protein
MNSLLEDKIDKILNDLLEILAALDGRVRKLEIINQVKKHPSYLKPVNKNEQQSKVLDLDSTDLSEIKILSLLEHLSELTDKISTRISKLEETK